MPRIKVINHNVLGVNFSGVEDCYWLRNYDINNKKVRKNNGNWENTPPDDGYDKAFFFFLKDTSMSFEWLCYNTRVNQSVMLEKLISCGYNPNYDGLLANGDTSISDIFYKKVDNYYNNK